MSLAVRFELVAQKELRQAVCWLNADRPGRGTRFANAVRKQAQSIADQPDRWPEVEDGVRQSPVPRWRMYSLYYAVFDGHIDILSVFHSSRKPKDW